MHRARVRSARLGVLPGSFHPITRAHVALAQAALEHVDEVVFVMPEQFPHKEYEWVDLEGRLHLVRAAAREHERFSVAVSRGGLFVEIARECKEAWGAGCDPWFLCGRDAAERIMGWDYGEARVGSAVLEEFGLLVAQRQGIYKPPADAAERVRTLAIGEEWDAVSATEVRRRIAAGEPWDHLVPEAAAKLAGDLYR
ncbi:MAG: adenylyltransferase/cytidyltransferase family protein [Bryobacteraceae bacterium]